MRRYLQLSPQYFFATGTPFTRRQIYLHGNVLRPTRLDRLVASDLVVLQSIWRNMPDFGYDCTILDSDLCILASGHGCDVDGKIIDTSWHVYLLDQ